MITNIVIALGERYFWKNLFVILGFLILFLFLDNLTQETTFFTIFFASVSIWLLPMMMGGLICLKDLIIYRGISVEWDFIIGHLKVYKKGWLVIILYSGLIFPIFRIITYYG